MVSRIWSVNIWRYRIRTKNIVITLIGWQLKKKLVVKFLCYLVCDLIGWELDLFCLQTIGDADGLGLLLSSANTVFPHDSAPLLTLCTALGSASKSSALQVGVLASPWYIYRGWNVYWFLTITNFGVWFEPVFLEMGEQRLRSLCYQRYYFKILAKTNSWSTYWTYWYFLPSHAVSSLCSIFFLQYLSRVLYFIHYLQAIAWLQRLPAFTELLARNTSLAPTDNPDVWQLMTDRTPYPQCPDALVIPQGTGRSDLVRLVLIGWWMTWFWEAVLNCWMML